MAPIIPAEMVTAAVELVVAFATAAAVFFGLLMGRAS